MGKPIILTLDDDVNVLRAIERDLRKQYSSDYRVLRAESGASALELVEQLKHRGDVIALFVVDQRMPKMTGVEFLENALKLFPDAKRVLLTAYADTDAAIGAINKVQIDNYLLKPWDPPEEKLYPALTDLLDDWRQTYTPPFEGLRIVGSHWSPASHQVKDFLARNGVPYLWLDPDDSEEGRGLIDSSKEDLSLPAVFFPDGTVQQKPNDRELAEKVGIQTTAEKPFYDLIVAGGGPAGLAAAVYGASEGLRTLVIERKAPGGQAGMSSRIENYLGFPGGLSGGDLARRAVSQAKRLGAEIVTAVEIVGVRVNGPTRTVQLSNGEELSCRAFLISTGVSYRWLDAKGVSDLTGAGVYYGAAMTEGESIRGKHVCIVGGGNSAGQAAMYFSRFAENVSIVIRRDSLESSMSKYLIDQLGDTENIEILAKTEVKEAIGSDRLEQLVLSRDGGERKETVDAAALFVFIGAAPQTDWLGDLVARDPKGYIFAGPDVLANGRSVPFEQLNRSPFMLETSVPGIFVAGDVRHGSIKRVASAVGEGSMAVTHVHRYLAAS